MERIDQLNKRLHLLDTIMTSFKEMPPAVGMPTTDILENVSLMLDWKGELQNEIQSLTNTNFSIESFSTTVH